MVRLLPPGLQCAVGMHPGASGQHRVGAAGLLPPHSSSLRRTTSEAQLLIDSAAPQSPPRAPAAHSNEPGHGRGKRSPEERRRFAAECGGPQSTAARAARSSSADYARGNKREPLPRCAPACRVLGDPRDGRVVRSGSRGEAPPAVSALRAASAALQAPPAGFSRRPSAVPSRLLLPSVFPLRASGAAPFAAAAELRQPEPRSCPGRPTSRPQADGALPRPALPSPSVPGRFWSSIPLCGSVRRSLLYTRARRELRARTEAELRPDGVTLLLRGDLPGLLCNSFSIHGAVSPGEARGRRNKPLW